MHVATCRINIKNIINLTNSKIDAVTFVKFNTSSLNLINLVMF